VTNQSDDDWANYGIVPGPVHNNFNVCPPGDFICSFEYYSREQKRQFTYDLYLTNGGSLGKSYLYRCADDWEGAYGSGPLCMLFESITVSDLHKQILRIFLHLGNFNWVKNS
jgi:hypothetical protein